MAPTSSYAPTTMYVLRQTADDLHRSGAVMHRSAEVSRKKEATRRRHSLGNAIIAEAHAIEGRIRRLARRAARRTPR